MHKLQLKLRDGDDDSEEAATAFPIEALPIESAKAFGMAARSGPQGAGRHKVLFITGDPDFYARMSESFGDFKEFELRQLRGRISELENKLSDAELPDVAVIDLSQGDVLDIDALERLKKARFSKIPIIAISDYLDQTIVRGLMRVKVDDWLPAGCLPIEVQRSCRKALRARAADEGARHAKCFTFFPANGGCGNTTLAIQAAFHIGNRKKQLSSTCLVDLNFQDGALADYLDLSPAFQLSGLSNMSGRLDRQLLDIMLTRHGSGLAVLAAPRTPGRFIDVGEGLIASILGLLSEAFDHLIIDLPKNWHPWTDNVIWGSDRIFVVSGFTIPALRQARFMADAIAAKASSETEVSVIINKFHEPLMGAGLTRKDAENILSTRFGGAIPNIGGVVDDAINRGVTLSGLRAGNKLEKKLSEILDRDPLLAKA